MRRNSENCVSREVTVESSIDFKTTVKEKEKFVPQGPKGIRRKSPGKKRIAFGRDGTLAVLWELEEVLEEKEVPETGGVRRLQEEPSNRPTRHQHPASLEAPPLPQASSTPPIPVARERFDSAQGRLRERDAGDGGEELRAAELRSECAVG
ncbi:hypothetical protein H6P81_008958 [Aristolochia fimbriata]|uniref:Uncharacterized protein n=1 Tax=Aristolochia fimbriata TaxID=158543 RepID=A0AAV7EJQ0_ARIFI|nr:hypothetical protein H6P81_008958 [Aristolochia fimbriata]